jgi:hypothetical protein
MDHHLTERMFLAVKGYHELKDRIERDIQCSHGADALRGMAFAMRGYALERPGISAATFRNPLTECPEWRIARDKLRDVVLRVLAENGVTGERAHHALRILGSLVRGFLTGDI